MSKRFLRRAYGWRPDKPDFRDYLFERQQALQVPSAIDLRPQCPPVLDQGRLGSCTAHAIAEAIEFDRMRQKLSRWVPSRLFIYYQERVIEGTIKEDAGAEIRDGIKSVAKDGAPPESYWPYTVSKFTRNPTKTAYAAALKHKSVTYKRLDGTNVDAFQRLASMKNCLAAGFPFVGGFSVYESFESDQVANTGVVPMPSSKEAMIGGHAVLFVGYDDSKSTFWAQNSWGKNWGAAGFFTIPYDYLTNSDLSSDFWQISVVQ
jgi:C1A family cysteine protease